MVFGGQLCPVMYLIFRERICCLCSPAQGSFLKVSDPLSLSDGKGALTFPSPRAVCPCGLKRVGRVRTNGRMEAAPSSLPGFL